MSKVMLVEDDDSLREIYSIRLTAEGYTIVTAKDGEEALAVAVRERPDLIVSDVMMPKISGFDMLDILRSTPETQNIKVIMMTALSSEDQRVRGESLGADRYLVKSQVGIEDVVNVVHDVLGDRAADETINPSTPANDAAMPAATETVIEMPGAQPAFAAQTGIDLGTATGVATIPVGVNGASAPVVPTNPVPAQTVQAGQPVQSARAAQTEQTTQAMPAPGAPFSPVA
jgi:CheY-like chemotaxis protein